MARIESVAVGGYYKTPTHLLPRITPLLAPYHGDETVSFMDPCAGEGEAILHLAQAWIKNQKIQLYTCEMEATRAGTLQKICKDNHWGWVRTSIHGDAFCVTFNGEGVSVLFLNPPYDTDRVHGRLEHKFLSRFTSGLKPGGGVLLFVVPHYALAASAEFLATEYDDPHCFKFPEEDFASFKQVVLFARRLSEPRLVPEPTLKERIKGWATDPSNLPELPNLVSKPLGEVLPSSSYRGSLSEWRLQPTDMIGLIGKARPWTFSSRGGHQVPVLGVLPDVPIESLLLRKYPVATPPRPAHIAAGIAAGIFNGSRVEPTDSSTRLPPLLVKGVFDQEWRTVEEKTNKKGEVTSVVQVQQPKLVATVLDLTTYQYHTLQENDSESPDVGTLSVAGLLKHYGDSLMEVMEKQCPILYDPRKDGDSIPLAPTARTLYIAQQHATKALVKLLGGPGLPLKARRGKGAILLGEIGSGKTSVSISLVNTIGSKRPLVLCPPHLLDSWRDEAAQVLPDVEVRVLRSVGDIEALAADTQKEMILSVVSRETAKLSHGWEGVGPLCPRCGSPTPKVDLARKRMRCKARHLVPTGKLETRKLNGPLARLVLKLANQLIPYDPTDPTVEYLLQGRWDRKRIAFYKGKYNEDTPPVFPGFTPNYFDDVLDALLPRFSEGDRVAKAIVWILLCLGSVERVAQVAEHFLSQPRVDYRLRDFGRHLLFLLPPNGQRQLELIHRYGDNNHDVWNPWGQLLNQVSEEQQGLHSHVAGLPLLWEGGRLTVEKAEARSLGAAKAALTILSRLSGLQWSKPCGEILFQAVPEPRRVALADHIYHRYPALFDALILDECHEYSTAGSAQQQAGHRLTGLGLPTLLMTGSVMNGYAESLFMNMWAISPPFREEFVRSDKSKFNDRYGYRKRLLQDRDEEGSVVEFGSMSDRVTRSNRVIGNAPGVLPLFLLRHLLPISVTLHKADLALELPPCTQERELIDPDPELLKRYRVLQTKLIAQIRKDQFNPELAGKLFGQLAELPSYLDRATADTGNTEEGDYTIRYPESVGNEVVATQPPLPASEVLPKEEWLLRKVQQELSEGRNVLVFSWHTSLLQRYARLISDHIDQKVPILYANKVGTAKRQEWITKQVVKKGVRVLVTNPIVIQTGLNNLVHFATELWMENPACNPIIYRQAVGRVDRIGQRIPTRIFSPIYAGTLQQQLYDLLLQKVAVSVSTDGLDPESALLAAGIGTDAFMTGLSIGKQLWAMLSEGFTVNPKEQEENRAYGQV